MDFIEKCHLLNDERYRQLIQQETIGLKFFFQARKYLFEEISLMNEKWL